MSPPTGFITGFFLPSSKYTCALKTAEPRLNFALCCGSLSQPAHVPVYDAATLDQTLDAVTAAFLLEKVKVLSDGKSVRLPIAFSWYAKDFAAPSSKSGRATAADCVRYVARYTRDAATREKLLALAPAPNVRFHPFSFRCRTLALLSEEELALMPVEAAGGTPRAAQSSCRPS
jgi:hypothetical protein